MKLIDYLNSYNLEKRTELLHIVVDIMYLYFSGETIKSISEKLDISEDEITEVLIDNKIDLRD